MSLVLQSTNNEAVPLASRRQVAASLSALFTFAVTAASGANLMPRIERQDDRSQAWFPWLKAFTPITTTGTYGIYVSGDYDVVPSDFGAGVLQVIRGCLPRSYRLFVDNDWPFAVTYSVSVRYEPDVVRSAQQAQTGGLVESPSPPGSRP